MEKNFKKEISQLALKGLLGGAIALPTGAVVMTVMSPSVAICAEDAKATFAETHACSGMNVCRGLGGCKVTTGKMENKVLLRVLRENELVGEGKITSLQKGTDSVSEIKEGHECGVRYEGNFKVQEGDLLEAYKVEKRKRTLG